MSYMAIATALVEVVPLISRMINHPKKGPEVARKISNIARVVTCKTDPHQIAECFYDNPEMLLEFYKKLMQTEKEIYLAMLSDRARARERNNIKRSTLLLCVSVCGLVSCLYLLTNCAFSSETTMILSTACGVFGACLKDIYAFEFSSQSTIWHIQDEKGP